ncbi:MAG: DUF4412 domain-containing protein [Gammaproteobacteria bacterium]|nr:DUF4412 domain-containing protein [Gammaproteobacteria bacterium]
MIRFAVILVVSLGLFCTGVPANAGWLTDKLKEAGKEIADEAIDDAVDEAYEEGKETVSQDEDEDNYEADDEDEFSEDEVYGDNMGDMDESRHSLDECGEVVQYQPGKKDKKAALRVRHDLHFTAESTVEDPTGESPDGTSIVYIDGTKLRMDLKSGDSTDFSLIVMGAKPEDKFYSLYHSEKMYAVSTLEDSSSEIWESYSDAGEPCEGYRTANKMGSESIAGRRTVKWSCADAEPPGSAVDMQIWIDNELRIPMKFESACSRFVTTRLDVGRPDQKVFSLPKGYRELVMPTP